MKHIGAYLFLAEIYDLFVKKKYLNFLFLAKTYFVNS